MWLSEKDRKYLNNIYTMAYKKYFGWTAPTPNVEVLSYSEAVSAARGELEECYVAKRAEINAKHDKRVNAINTEASKRGLLTSTIVLQQIERAEYERERELAKFESVSEEKVRTAARKMLSENFAAVKLSWQSNRDTLELIIKKSNISGISPIDLQKAMDEEVYAEYLRFLLALEPNVARAYVENDPLFYYNLSQSYFQKLESQMQLRGWDA